jgi:hypothetical protein
MAAKTLSRSVSDFTVKGRGRKGRSANMRNDIAKVSDLIGDKTETVLYSEDVDKCDLRTVVRAWAKDNGKTVSVNTTNVEGAFVVKVSAAK